MACILSLNPALLLSDVVAVRHREGVVHGFLTFKNAEGKTLAVGEEIDTPSVAMKRTRRRFAITICGTHSARASLRQEGRRSKFSMSSLVNSSEARIVAQKAD
jgi:hypothetical protein